MIDPREAKLPKWAQDALRAIAVAPLVGVLLAAAVAVVVGLIVLMAVSAIALAAVAGIVWIVGLWDGGIEDEIIEMDGGRK